MHKSSMLRNVKDEARMQTQPQETPALVETERVANLLSSGQEQGMVVHCLVQLSNSPFPLRVSIVYGSNEEHEHQLRWKNLVAFDPGPSTAWLVSGDFNEMRYSTEKQGVQFSTLQWLHKFNAYLENCNLHDLQQFVVVQERLSDDQATLHSLQVALLLDPLNQGLIEEETRERRRYAQSLHTEEEVMRQKARLN
ncbi:hypothetical protein QJS10_CPA09g01073 [Acorus calamus]|uniref:Endonuclease/exonuclease/phosphatase domain-containing protein n=1 Tax=Acorus calamus TaxID=4465 RepID=A0AAV9E4M0_ACOCL|nr:hypothetical protein QJS10_CPA09g01073 [Acorus calamus]